MSEPLRPAGGLARAGSDLLGHLFYLMPVEEGEFLSPSLLGPSFSHAHPLSICPQVAFRVMLVALFYSMIERNQGNWTLSSTVCTFKTTQGLSSELSESVLSCSFLGGLCSFNTSLLRVWLLDQPHRHCLGACLQCRIPGPTPNRLKQNLQFNKIHQRFVCSGKFEKQCFRLQPSGKFSLFGWILNVQGEEVSQVPCVSPESQAKGEPCLRRWTSPGDHCGMHVQQWVVEALFSFGSDLNDCTFGGQGLGMFLSNEGGMGLVHQEKRGLTGLRP